MSNPNELGLHFGGLEKPIAEQLAEQGFKTKRDYQIYADHIVRLNIHGYLTDSETEKARKRLLKEIARNIEPLGESQ